MSSAPWSPGFVTRLLMVLLRIAIGWHFLYEGLVKLESFETDRPFRAEAYLQQAQGPLRDFFRDLAPEETVGDPYHLKEKGLDAIVEDVFPEWDGYLERFETHYSLSDAQYNALFEKLEALKAEAEAYFNDEDGARTAQIEEYRRLGKQLDESSVENLPPFERQLAEKKRLEYLAVRQQLVGWLDDATTRLRNEFRTVLTNEQLRSEPMAEEKVNIGWTSVATAWLLTLAGAGMLLGLFSRISCLAAAVFLTMVYFSMPPWPGLDPNPIAEGNYMIVSKNLIELLAVLMLATTPSGRWAGLDALVHGLLVRPLRRRFGGKGD